MEFLRPSTNAILPSLIHYRANHDPDSPFALFPSHGDSWARITFSQFAHASHRFARAVRTPTNDGTRQVVGLIVDCDNILYATAIAGLTCGGMTVSGFRFMSDMQTADVSN
jgi:acyl-CoA synthetase (AMP-forming)/AMP-acid ligase II